MMRPTNSTSVDKEATLQQAIAAFRNKEKSVADAIAEFNIPRRTFCDRLSGKPPHNKAHENHQLLTHAEEKELVRWITRLTITGYPPQHATLIEMADVIQRKRNPSHLASNRHTTNLKTIGSQWIRRFLQRHSELSSV